MICVVVKDKYVKVEN